MSSLAEIERAAGALPKHEMERLFVFLAVQMGCNDMTGEASQPFGRHGVLDIPPVHLGGMLPQPGKEDRFGEMLEGRP